MLILIIMMILFFTIAMILMTLNLLISKKKKNDREKFSSFECGFDPMSSSRLPFSIQFFMISIIFLIFDIELVILLPMIPSFIYSSIELSSSSLFYFIMMLIMGLYIEWNDGALKWLK